jgi:hypothetical protein
VSGAVVLIFGHQISVIEDTDIVYKRMYVDDDNIIYLPFRPPPFTSQSTRASTLPRRPVALTFHALASGRQTASQRVSVFTEVTPSPVGANREFQYIYLLTAATESTTVISHLQQCARQPAREFHYIIY